jgi:UDP-N-acetylmuramoyl-L-alanyl-D-glutamate--2,6-diaminopimelate ligase
MQLRQLLDDVPVARLAGDPATAIRGLAYDSRQVEPGFLFAALRGQNRDGNEFVDEAIGRGAAAVLSARPAPPRAPVAWVQVEDDRLALALLARNYYGRPDERLLMIGVTGTNGKTTVAFMLEALLREAGMRPCLIGTVLYRHDREEIRAARTTPESLDLVRLLDRFATAGAAACAMEVSSHALALRRVAGLRFRVAVFTNLTQDHLDFHGTMDAYFEAKALLFRDLPPEGIAVLNADDPRSEALRARTRARVYGFGATARADVRIVGVQTTRDGTRVEMATAPGVCAAQAVRLTIRSPLLGRPNAGNLAAAAATGLALGLPIDTITRGLESVRGVVGRFERLDLGLPCDILIDYAHTEDALANLLRAVHELRPRRILVVFGCGGDRDRGKRPLMGAAAAAHSDLAIVTSDNPRSEDPQRILDDILPGVRRALGGSEDAPLDPQRCLVIPDRREAIHRALSLAGEGDCVVIAGKGHETYQILGDRTVPFDDREVAREFARGRAAGGPGHAAPRAVPTGWHG